MKTHCFRLPWAFNAPLFFLLISRLKWASLLIACAGYFSSTSFGSDCVFTNVANSSGPELFRTFMRDTGLNYVPAINPSGTVAFYGARLTGDEGIFRGNGGPLTTVATTSDPTYFTFLERPVINAANTVAFEGVLNAGGAGLFAKNGGVTTTIALNSGTPFSLFSPLSINDSGSVAFEADFDTGGDGVFVSNGSSTTTIALSSDPVFASFGAYPSINSAGTVAFLGFLDAGGRGIFTGNGAPTTMIASEAGPLNTLGTPVLNATGTIAFAANLDTGGSGIFSINSGILNTIALSEGTLLGSFPGAYSINLAGTVAFTAGLDAGGSGIFTGPDVAADKVIRTGDPLFGSTLTQFEMGFNALNDAGQVAFVYKLANGRSGIAVATPVVPEPATLALLLGGAACCATRRKRPVTG